MWLDYRRNVSFCGPNSKRGNCIIGNPGLLEVLSRDSDSVIDKTDDPVFLNCTSERFQTIVAWTMSYEERVARRLKLALTINIITERHKSVPAGNTGENPCEDCLEKIFKLVTVARRCERQ